MKTSIARKPLACVFILWLITLGCERKNTVGLILPEEKKALDSITQNFFHEAASRGIDVSGWRESLQVELSTLTKDHVGSCQPNSYPKTVRIDHYYWKIASPENREQLLFHELAHCLLQRRHVNESYSFGECKSWMREKDSDCLLNLRNKLWRKYYLDELFAQHPIDTPHWYVENVQQADFTRLRKHKSIRLTSQGARLDSLLIDDPENWLVVVRSPPPDSTNKPTYVGLSVNEFYFENNNFNIDHSSVSTAIAIVGQTPKSTLFKRDHGRSGFELVIQKRTDCAYVFLNDTLRYCLPISENKVIITGHGPIAVRLI